MFEREIKRLRDHRLATHYVKHGGGRLPTSAERADMRGLEGQTTEVNLEQLCLNSYVHTCQMCPYAYRVLVSDQQFSEVVHVGNRYSGEVVTMGDRKIEFVERRMAEHMAAVHGAVL